LQAALALRWASFAERLHARASTHASIAAAVDYRRAALALLGEHVCSARHAAEAAASTVSAATCGGIPRGTVLWAHGAMIRCRFTATMPAALSCSSNVHFSFSLFQSVHMASTQCTLCTVRRST
jgi:hypothetical protein